MPLLISVGGPQTAEVTFVVDVNTDGNMSRRLPTANNGEMGRNQYLGHTAWCETYHLAVFFLDPSRTVRALSGRYPCDDRSLRRRAQSVPASAERYAKPSAAVLSPPVECQELTKSRLFGRRQADFAEVLLGFAPFDLGGTFCAGRLFAGGGKQGENAFTCLGHEVFRSIAVFCSSHSRS